MRSQKRSRTFIRLLLLVVTIAAFATLLFNRQYFIDTIIAAQYQPSSEMSTIRDTLDLTDEGKRLFDASQPIIEDASTFNKYCNQHAETNNPILGCYTQQRIYVYRVTNPELDGIEQTTAAHELLHAVYERMSDADKATIDTALNDAYKKVTNPELEERMEYYRSAEPGQEVNELHSILGTEQMTLPTTLEEHYAKYFVSRQKIVNFFKQYNSIFTATTNRIKQLQEQINAETVAVNQRIERYNAAAASLQTDTSTFNTRNTSGEFTSQAEFNRERSQLVARQNELNLERDAIEQQINASQQLRSQYNQLVEKYNQLSRSINSSLDPVPTL